MKYLDDAREGDSVDGPWKIRGAVTVLLWDGGRLVSANPELSRELKARFDGHVADEVTARAVCDYVRQWEMLRYGGR